MTSIYNINKEWLQVLEQLESSDGYLTPDLEEKIKELTSSFDAAAENVVYSIKALESEIDTIEAEITRLKSRAQSRKNAIDRLKLTMVTCMQLNGVEKVKDPKFTIFIQNTKAVNIIGDIPEEYSRVVPAKIEPDKVKIKEFLSAGNTAIWCELVENKTLRIN